MRVPIIAWVAIGGVALWLLSRAKGTAGAAQGRIVGLSMDGVPMGAHLTSKEPGATVTVSVQMVNATRDFRAVLISWPFKVLFQLVDPAFVTSAFSPEGMVTAGGTSGFLASLTIPASAFDGKIYGVRAVLMAATSGPTGLPTTTFSQVAELTHSNAVKVTIPTGFATPSGSISTVDVAQVIMRRGQ